ncbi:hypothetical protein PLESTF_000711200 [Pleodorina starrii]|nr:hypothetical protein PLESTM_001800200 [Pleodorina starrii]GLC68584.1 hypothetical protein PLESTF_000711200 [Pleodorina starrii]
MPPAALQKLASGLSSGGANDHSPPTSGQGGRGGMIRGLLQTIRAGLSTDSGSPRSSRTGLGEPSVTPRGSQGQHLLATNLDSLRTESDDSDDDLCKRALSSGPNGRVTAPTITRTPLYSESGHIALPLEVPLAASRRYSGRRSGQATPAQSASSARPSFDTARTEPSSAIASSAVLSGGVRSLSSGPAPVLETAAKLLAEAVLPPPPPSLSPSPWLASAAAPAHAAEANPSWQAPQEPVWQASADSAAGGARGDAAAASSWAVNPPGPGVPETASQTTIPLPGAEAPSPFTAVAVPPLAPEVQPATAAARPTSGTRFLQPPVRRLLLDSAVAAVSGSAAVASAAPVSKMPQRTRSDASSNDGEAAAGGEGGVAGAAPPATGGDEVDVSGPEIVEATSAAAQQQQQQRHCRSASTTALSAMAVSQAVHRLQMRQQQEKAAARFGRSSTHIFGGGGGGAGGGSSGLHHQYPPQSPYPRDIVAEAPAQRVLSVASDGSGGSGGEQGAPAPHGDAAAAALSPAGSGPSPQLLQSPARRLGFSAAAQPRSTTGSFLYQHALYDGHRAGVAGGGRPSVHRTADKSGGSAGLDEWLGDVPDMSGGRLTPVPTPASDWGGRSSMSYTEGHVSAAERLQAMVSGVASVGGDDAASYLQQLLIPDMMPSTASVDLHYSSTSTRVPSVLALAYGSSGGPATVSATASAAAGCGLWGMMQLQTGGSPLACSGYGGGGGGGGEGFTPASPAAAAVGNGGAHARHLSAQGHSMYGDMRTSRPSTGGGSSAACSRHGSMILNSAAAPLFGGGNMSYGVGGGSATSGSGTFAMLETAGSNQAAAAGSASTHNTHTSAGANALPHVNKSAMQLVDELREVQSAAAAATADSPPPPQQQQQQQQRDELVAALWRLVRAKDSDAVNYLLSVDPSSRPNRPIAPVLKEMRSWVYLNMW